MVAVNVDRPAAVPADLIATLHEDIVVVLDPEYAIARPYRLRGLPTTLLIDRKGRVRARQAGFDPQQKEVWQERIGGSLQEK